MLVNAMKMYTFTVTVKRMISDLKVELPNVFAIGIIDGYRGDIMRSTQCSNVYLQSVHVFDSTDCPC